VHCAPPLRCIEAVLLRDKPSCPLCRRDLSAASLIDPPPPPAVKPEAEDEGVAGVVVQGASGAAGAGPSGGKEGMWEGRASLTGGIPYNLVVSLHAEVLDISTLVDRRHGSLEVCNEQDSPHGGASEDCTQCVGVGCLAFLSRLTENLGTPGGCSLSGHRLANALMQSGKPAG
jgi:hypothetical protein